MVAQQMKIALDFESIAAPISGIAAAARSKDYVDIWRMLLDERAFSILLSDYSLFEFRAAGAPTGWVSLCYYPVPVQALSFSEYCREFAGEHVHPSDLRTEYGEYLTTCPLRQHVHPVRYDVDPDAYDAGRHPVAHLHIGHASEIRLATSHYWRPMTLLAFVCRQYYPAAWMDFNRRHAEHGIYRQVRDRLREVESHFFEGIAARKACLR